MDEAPDLALAPKPPDAIEKAELGAKRILSGMGADRLALVKKEPPARPRVFALSF